jgi:uncharacterized repeat protein (TIGR01451 family)
MNTNRIYQVMAMLVVAAIAIVAPLSAEAAGTASGTLVGNTATVSYDVSGVPQTPLSTGPTATFAVDNKVNLTVTKNSDITSIPGSTNQTLVFTVTNNGNTAQRYALSATNSAGIVMNNVRIYLDNGATPNTWDATDTLYVDASTFGNLAADGSLKILIVADTPAGATNGQTSNYNLIATTVDAGTVTVTVQTGGAGTLAGVDVVFADVAGSAAGDGARDGKHSAVGTYTVSGATLSILKSAATYSDPFNGTANPKAIPGAIMTYTITVSNASGATATNVTVSDNLTGMPVTFAPHFNDGITVVCSATQGIVVNGTCKTNAGFDDGADYNITTANTVLVSGLTVTAGTSAVIKFQVTVN